MSTLIDKYKVLLLVISRLKKKKKNQVNWEGEKNEGQFWTFNEVKYIFIGLFYKNS